MPGASPSTTASQRISHAIVMTDALNICDGITKPKKRTLTQRRAAYLGAPLT